MGKIAQTIDRVVETSVNRAVAECAENALRQAVASGALDDAIAKAVFKPGVVLQRWAFEAAVAGEIWRADKTQTKEQARAAAKNVVDIVVSEAGEYGDPAYAWDFDAARTCAHEIEISYWDERS